MKLAILIVSSSLMLGACASSNEDRGALLGAVAGGVLGNQIGSGRGQTLATAAGMMAGGSAGGAVGRRMDEHDQQQMQNAQGL